MLQFEAVRGPAPGVSPARRHSPPGYSLKHSIGNSDGRCVQRAETHSMHAGDVRLLGIPRSRRIIAIVDPQHGSVSQTSQRSLTRGHRAGPAGGWRRACGYPHTPRRPPAGAVDKKLVAGASVARERPRTSESITDLLSPHASAG